jgi:mRNA interferase HigB
MFDVRLSARCREADHFQKKSVAGFLKRHPGARSALLACYLLAQVGIVYGYNDLEQTFARENYVPPQYFVFDTGGDQFWIVAAIHYNRQSLFVRRDLTHAEYDLWTRKNLNS